MPELSLKVEGMNCSHCKKAVEDALLKKVDGIKDVQVDLENKEVVVNGSVSREQVVNTIEDTGYNVVN